MKTAVLAVAETSATGLHPVSHEIIAFAEALAGLTDLPVTACVVGETVDKAAEALQLPPGGEVTGISVPGLEGYDPESYVAALTDMIVTGNYAYICIPHTARGCDFAPVLAAKLGGACVTGVEKVEISRGRLTCTRRILNGKKVARIAADLLPAVLTVQPGIFKPDESRQPTRAELQIRTFRHTPAHIEALGIKSARTDAESLQNADVIVAAGNGIGSAENLDLIRQLAERFPRSAVAGSRPVCDRQWLPYGCQIGVTGAVVRPKLYIACGISGANQHVAGIREAGCIVAINRDPNAAIFNFADYGIVEDLTTFTPLLVERIDSDR